MRRSLILTVAPAALLGLACLWPAPDAFAQRNDKDRAVSDIAARAQARPKRAPTRIRVTPRCRYRLETLDYPPPYDCEYPGPGYVRQCVARLVQENRPSGTVVVPRMRCWWEPG